jgi:hypothetical protein
MQAGHEQHQLCHAPAVFALPDSFPSCHRIRNNSLYTSYASVDKKLLHQPGTDKHMLLLLLQQLLLLL